VVEAVETAVEAVEAAAVEAEAAVVEVAGAVVEVAGAAVEAAAVEAAAMAAAARAAATVAEGRVEAAAVEADSSTAVVQTVDVAGVVPSLPVVIEQAAHPPSDDSDTKVSTADSTTVDEEDDMPAWLRGPSPMASPPASVVDDNLLVDDVTHIVYDDEVVVTLNGRIPPPLLRKLAMQRASLPLESGGAALVPLFHQGSRLHVGPFVVDTGSYHSGRYRAVRKTSTSEQVASRRIAGDVARLHRMRRHEYERR
jgi:hypothetical protein